MNQNDTILNYLASGHGLSRLEALFSFRIQNITARIRDLRNAGVEVKTRMKRDPQGADYAEYYIDHPTLERHVRDGIVSTNTGAFTLSV